MGNQPSGMLDRRDPKRLAAVWRKAKMQAERCGARAHAEDIAQTVVISLWRLPPDGDDWSAVALVYARRCVARIIAQRERAQVCLDECRMVVPSAEPSTLQRWLQERERTLLANALEELRKTEPDWFEAVCALRLEEVPAPEAAARAGIPYGTLLTRDRLGRRRLRAILARWTAQETFVPKEPNPGSSHIRPRSETPRDASGRRGLFGVLDPRPRARCRDGGSLDRPGPGGAR